ncbi:MULTISPECIES: molybdopterin oxidoreductase family protein [Streptomyces]|uniref:Nitrite reductase n=1 Tax=Streptomyces tsukubensis (strain DSM 42081 / NBRC 108919 / NRRL 18488 / 9993) TaxID=1114943 RepID=I2MZY1_STRT9|nr:molybdopterin oxidoreductase family protein [Streptomyces tsukubensis]MYS68387.1 molybdopterin-dependent oxidoreductase [Streptomyces sp. SID5473]AZK94563.1 nitrite reductase [Streptomyces tsukubensis]EIF90328.1 assimilatory nitrate reductase catalytic subunit [Streptomyces tsukubensis NRRL18488]QKM69349.1 nitrite reductase [Streptomyces tsukubensis NRRL18488]TAI42719.1 nitrite reductase [Streptomyces tsukubensis]
MTSAPRPPATDDRLPLDPALAPPGTTAFRDAGGLPAGNWRGARDGETLVPTHCCFCGVQCGIYLRVDRTGTVFGVEPRNHDINRMRLCPKGINAYQQVNHPDRLTAPLVRSSRDEPFREVSWDEALSVTAAGIRAVQARHGNDAFGMLGGASLFTEKTYLVGKFARIALKTRHVDYNGRLCMVSAAGANKLAFGIDRAGNPFSDILLTDCLLIAGANVGECFPVLTQYVWGARDRGAKLIVVDPRETAVARTADIHVALRPGTDAAFFNAVLHVVVEESLTDEAFLATRTSGWEEARAAAADCPPRRAAEICGVPAEQIAEVARVFGTADKAMAWHARGIEHHTQGVDNCLAVINLCAATGNIGRPGAGYGTLTGQGNGQGGREHGQKSDLLPGGRSINDPEHRRQISRIWGIDEAELPRAGTSMVEMVHQMRRGEIRGLLGICNNPFVSLPDLPAVTAAYDTLDFHVQCDFFLSETAANAHVVLPVTTWAEDEGVMANAEARVVKHNKAQEPPPGVRTDTWVMCRLAQLLGAGDKFAFTGSRDVFEELRIASAGTVNDYYGITYERLEETGGIAWPCPTTDHPGTPRLFEDGRTHHPDGLIHLQRVEWRPPADPYSDEYPLSLTTGRTVAHFLSGNQTRRLGALVEQTPRPWVELHPAHGFRNGDPVRVVTRRGATVLPALVTEAIRPDTVFVPYHWPIPTAANTLTNAALDPRSKIPEYKVCACRLERAEHLDEVPAPPTPPGRSAYPPKAQAARTDPLPPTAPQGRGTAERS